jgi:hypothetical protein
MTEIHYNFLSQGYGKPKREKNATGKKRGPTVEEAT